MTYQMLLDKLSLLSKEQLMNDVVIHDMLEDEFYGTGAGITFEVADSEHGVLDEDHPIICVRK
jgi:hypothetical protein